MHKDPSSFDPETDNKPLIASLQTIYQQDNQRLDRIWQRLSQHVEQDQAAEPIYDIIELDNERNHSMQPEFIDYPAIPTKKRHHWTTFVATIAATLMIVTTLLVYTVINHNTQSASPGTLQTTQTGAYISHEGLLKLDSKDGHTLWHYVIPNTTSYNQVNFLGEANNVAYILTVELQVHAIDAISGKLLWKQSFSTASSYFQASTVYQAMYKSVVTETALFIVLDKSVLKLDGSTGKLLHTYTFPTITGENTTITKDNPEQNRLRVVAQDDGVYITWYNTLYVFDSTTNAEKWHKTIDGVQNLTKPLVENDQVYIAGYSKTPSGGFASSQLYAFKTNNGQQVWASEKMNKTLIVVGIKAQNGLVYTVGINSRNLLLNDENDFNSKLYAHNAKDGSLVWSKPVSEMRAQIVLYKYPETSNTLDVRAIGVDWVYPITNTSIYTKYGTTSSIKFKVLDTLTGAEKWSIDLTSKSNGTPTPAPDLHGVGVGDSVQSVVVQDDIVYVQDQNTLYALNEKGQQLWKITLPSPTNK